MQILFAISIVSFLLLLWAAVAITRHILASHKPERSSELQPGFNQHHIDASEAANSSASHSMHSPKGQTVAAHMDWNLSPAQTRPSMYNKATSPQRD